MIILVTIKFAFRGMGKLGRQRQSRGFQRGSSSSNRLKSFDVKTRTTDEEGASGQSLRGSQATATSWARPEDGNDGSPWEDECG